MAKLAKGTWEHIDYSCLRIGGENPIVPNDVRARIECNEDATDPVLLAGIVSTCIHRAPFCNVGETWIVQKSNDETLGQFRYRMKKSFQFFSLQKLGRNNRGRICYQVTRKHPPQVAIQAAINAVARWVYDQRLNAVGARP